MRVDYWNFFVKLMFPFLCWLFWSLLLSQSITHSIDAIVTGDPVSYEALTGYPSSITATETIGPSTGPLTSPCDLKMYIVAVCKAKDHSNSALCNSSHNWLTLFWLPLTPQCDPDLLHGLLLSNYCHSLGFVHVTPLSFCFVVFNIVS